MGLKQDIVIVSQYSTRKTLSSRGTRGSTPGAYMKKYMMRDEAAEGTVEKFRKEDYKLIIDRDAELARKGDELSYIEGYMLRKDAVEPIDEKGADGIAFGRGKLMMTEKEVKEECEKIQKAFDTDLSKTWIKTVISFDTEYLKKIGILPADFVFENEGQARGLVDQVRLRQAIDNGMKRIAKNYDDLHYVGGVHINTKHVHVHLSIMDMGKGNIMPDGHQRGKISQDALNEMRRGMDLFLDQTKEVQHLSAQVGHHRKNIEIQVKRHLYDQVTLYGAPQMLMAVLPPDKGRWRAGSNSKDMKRANKICKAYVTELLKDPEFEMEETMASLKRYAHVRAEKEDLSKESEQTLINKGYDLIIEKCMNSVYQMLAALPDDVKQDASDVLEIATSEDLQHGDNPLQSFIYHLRAYDDRFRAHKEIADEVDANIRQYYEYVESGGVVDENARVFKQFMDIEHEYQHKCISKYSHFLPFESFVDTNIERSLVELSDMRRDLLAYKMLDKDKSLVHMKDPEEAEAYAFQIYHVRGGGKRVSDPDKFHEELDEKQEDYNKQFDKMNEMLHNMARTIKIDDSGAMRPVLYEEYDFDEVRGIDLHDLTSDFTNVVEFDGFVREAFLDMADRRIGAYDALLDYMSQTHQRDDLVDMLYDDIDRMREVAEALRTNNTNALKASASFNLSLYPKKRVARLSYHTDDGLRDAVKDASKIEQEDIDLIV